MNLKNLSYIIKSIKKKEKKILRKRISTTWYNFQKKQNKETLKSPGLLI